jgi:hypothetical protein
MLKKIILGMGLVGVLATAGFGEDVKLDKNFCKAYNYATYNYLVDEDYSNAKTAIDIATKRNGTKEAGDQRFSAVYGQMSTDFIKEAGIGYSVSMNWGNVVLAFNEYMKYAHSDEDKKELRKFQISLFYFGTWKSEYIDTNKYSFRYCIYENTFNLYSEHLKGRIGNDIGALKFTDSFAQAKGTENILSPLVKYIINKDYERAKEYIKQVNEDSGINEIYSEFENACEK